MTNIQSKLAALMVFVSSVLIAYVSFSGDNTQAYLFPYLLGFVMVILAFVDLIRTLVGKNVITKNINSKDFINILPGVAVMFILVFVLSEWLGFYSASFLGFVAIYSLYDASSHKIFASWLKRVALAFGFVIFLYLVFAMFLYVITPIGVWV